MTFKANVNPLEKWLGALFGRVVHDSFSMEITKFAFLKDGKVLQAKLDGRCVAWLLRPEGLTKGLSRGCLWKFQQRRFKEPI